MGGLRRHSTDKARKRKNACRNHEIGWHFCLLRRSALCKGSLAAECVRRWDQASVASHPCGSPAAAHRANHRADFPGMQRRPDKTPLRCGRKNRTDCSPGQVSDRRQWANRGGWACFAGAAMHVLRHIPMFCCMRSNNCLRRYLRSSAVGAQPTASIYIVGGCDDGGRSLRATSTHDGSISGQIGSKSARILPRDVPWMAKDFGVVQNPIRAMRGRKRNSIRCFVQSGSDLPTIAAHAAQMQSLRRTRMPGRDHSLVRRM